MKFADCKTKKERVAFIREAMGNDARQAVRGMMRIYANQTADEQAVEDTKYHNGIGFAGCDATLLSSFAKQVERGRTLSPKQMAYVFKKMPKYAAQLEREAAAREADTKVVDRVIAEAKKAETEADYDNAIAVEEAMHKMVADAERESEARGAWSSMR